MLGIGHKVEAATLLVSGGSEMILAERLVQRRPRLFSNPCTDVSQAGEKFGLSKFKRMCFKGPP